MSVTLASEGIPNLAKPTFSSNLLAWQFRLLKNIFIANAFMSNTVTVTEDASPIRVLRKERE